MTSTGSGGPRPAPLLEPYSREWFVEPGDHEVDSSIVCVLTRFGLGSPHDVLPSYLDYRRVIRAARAAETPGLLQTAFLLDGRKAWQSLSIWSSRAAIGHFGTNVPVHVDIARRIFGRLAIDPERGPELWSTKWRLASVSNNLNWGGMDLRAAILDERAPGSLDGKLDR
jgi:hypothetical protein